MPLTLGDVVTCSGCGATAIAYTTGAHAAWKPGAALMVSWPGGRHEAASEPPEVCLWCRDGKKAPAPPTRRVSICDDLAARGCYLVGAEWNTDALLEDAYQAWISRGRPALDRVAIENAAGVPGVPCSSPAEVARVDAELQALADKLGAQAHAANVAEAVRPPEPFKAAPLVPKKKTKPPPAQGSLF